MRPVKAAARAQLRRLCGSTLSKANIQHRPVMRPVKAAAKAQLRRLCGSTLSNADTQHRALAAALRKASERESIKQTSLRKQLSAIREPDKIRRRAHLLLANLHRFSPHDSDLWAEEYDDSGKVRWVKLSLDRTRFRSPLEEAEAAFALARKQERGRRTVEEALGVSLERELELDDLVARLGDIGPEDDVSEILRAFKAIGGNVERTPLPPDAPPNPGSHAVRRGWRGRCFLSPRRVPIFVGRNSRENEELSLRIARDPDVWLHARDSPGAHVVLRLSQSGRDSFASPECLQVAADLAAFFSPMRNERRARVTVALAKHVLKLRGAPVGTVKLREELRTMFGFPSAVESLEEAQ